MLVAACGAEMRFDPSPSCSFRTTEAVEGDGGTTPILDRPKAVALGQRHACAITVGDDVRCWGANDLGQLGIEGALEPGTAHRYPSLKGADRVFAGGAHSCATVDGALYCWGNGDFGQLGPAADGGGPVEVPGVPAVSGSGAITLGLLHTCAHVGTEAWCWGDNRFGQLGREAGAFDASPAPVEGLTGVSAVTAGAFHTCALRQGLDESPEVVCWGRDAHGELGDGEAGGSRHRGEAVALDGFVTGLAAGPHHTCAEVLASGPAFDEGGGFCWGRGMRGELGNGATRDSATPVTVALEGFGGLFAGGSLSLDIVDGEVSWDTAAGHTCQQSPLRCWGSNEGGQLGDGTFEDRATPVAVRGDVGFASGSAGAGTCVVDYDNRLQCWGPNEGGQLGAGGAGWNEPREVHLRADER